MTRGYKNDKTHRPSKQASYAKLSVDLIQTEAQSAKQNNNKTDVIVNS